MKMKTPELVLGQGQRWWGPNKKESNFLKKKGDPHKKEPPQTTLSAHPAQVWVLLRPRPDTADPGEASAWRLRSPG